MHSCLHKATTNQRWWNPIMTICKHYGGGAIYIHMISRKTLLHKSRYFQQKIAKGQGSPGLTDVDNSWQNFDKISQNWTLCLYLTVDEMSICSVTSEISLSRICRHTFVLYFKNNVKYGSEGKRQRIIIVNVGDYSSAMYFLTWIDRRPIEKLLHCPLLHIAPIIAWGGSET